MNLNTYLHILSMFEGLSIILLYLEDIKSKEHSTLEGGDGAAQ